MTTIMQIYLTILLSLIAISVISKIIYKLFDNDITDVIFGLTFIVSTIGYSIFGFYILLAVVWHWY